MKYNSSITDSSKIIDRDNNSNKDEHNNTNHNDGHIRAHSPTSATTITATTHK